MPKSRNIEVYCLGNTGRKHVTATTSKHVSAATKLLESTTTLTRKYEPCDKVSSIWYAKIGFNERHKQSHRDPASRRRRRKGKSQISDSKIRSRVPRDSDPRMTALARASSNCKRQIRPLVRESAPHQQTRNCPTAIKIWS
jgi:hypothetical protein